MSSDTAVCQINNKEVAPQNPSKQTKKLVYYAFKTLDNSLSMTIYFLVFRRWFFCPLSYSFLTTQKSDESQASGVQDVAVTYSLCSPQFHTFVIMTAIVPGSCSLRRDKSCIYSLSVMLGALGTSGFQWSVERKESKCLVMHPRIANL